MSGLQVSGMLIDRTAVSLRLKMARKDAGYDSAADAAKAFGWKISTYTAHENGQNPIRHEVAERYSKAFRVNPKWILFGEDTAQLSTTDLETDTLEIMGDVVAGSFREPTAPASSGASGMMADPRFPREAQFCLKVHGDSMNACQPTPILDGALIRCLSLEYGGLPLRTGQIAVIHRTRGDMVETTLKRVVWIANSFEFRPESSNPAHKTFRPGPEDDGTTVTAFAIVTGIFNAVEV